MTEANRQELADKLAPLLGGTTHADSEPGAYGCVAIAINPRLNLILRHAKSRIEIIAHIVTSPAEREMLTYSQIPTLGSTTIDPTRPAAAIANQVKRKLIDPSPAIIEAFEAVVNRTKARTDHLAVVAADWKARIPSLRVTIDPGATSAQVSFYRDGGGYWGGRLNGDGGFYMDRGSLTPEQAAAFVAIFA